MKYIATSVIGLLLIATPSVHAQSQAAICGNLKNSDLGYCAAINNSTKQVAGWFTNCQNAANSSYTQCMNGIPFANQTPLPGATGVNGGNPVIKNITWGSQVSGSVYNVNSNYNEAYEQQYIGDATAPQGTVQIGDPVEVPPR